MKRSQIIIWALSLLLVVALWLFSSEPSALLKLLQSAVILIVGNMVAALSTVERRGSS